MPLSTWRITVSLSIGLISFLVAYLAIFPRPPSFQWLPGSLVTRAPPSPGPQCGDHPCLDLPNGLRIVNTHLKHITGVWELFESLGHPGMETFVPAAQRLSRATSKSYPVTSHDPIATEFLDLMNKFLMQGDKLEMELMNRLISSILPLFNSMMSLMPIHRTLVTLEPLESSNLTLSASALADIDKTFNSIVSQLVAEIQKVCIAALNESDHVFPQALTVSALGSELALGMDSELSRVKLALGRLPWSDAWTLQHWSGTSTTARYRAYLKLFDTEGETLRALADVASAIHENLGDLRDYCVWYTKNDTVHLIYEGRLSEGEASIAIMKGKIEGLLGRFKTISIAGQSRRFHSLVRANGESAFASFTIV
ncbi:hypothetical protein C8J57DRAFT_1382337 [Mycena rebaudengoi]|nr:hypothetical protein C8J57DRAFT_1382337 [Mycena rebaudengoi]